MFSQIVLFQQCYVDRALIGIDRNGAQSHCCYLFQHYVLLNGIGRIGAPCERPVIGDQDRRHLHRVYPVKPPDDNFAGV